MALSRLGSFAGALLLDRIKRQDAEINDVMMLCAWRELPQAWHWLWPVDGKSKQAMVRSELG